MQTFNPAENGHHNVFEKTVKHQILTNNTM